MMTLNRMGGIVTDIELRPFNDTHQVFFRGSWIGDIALFDNDYCWRFRIPHSMMWWKETDQDAAISNLISFSGIN